MTDDQLDKPLALPTPRFAVTPEDLYAQFPGVEPNTVLSALMEARRSVGLFGLTPEEADEMTTKIAVEQLKQMTGESTAGATARLDPEIHRRRRPSGGQGTVPDQS